MDAIMARVRDGQEPTRDLTEPRHSPEPVAPPTDAEAEANLAEGFKGAVAWERGFDRHTDFDGKPVWIDRATGEVFPGPELPTLQSDGMPVKSPRKP